MKKLLSIFLAFSLLFSLCVPVLAAGPADQVLTYSLDVGGEHEITVETGDVITVNYVIINEDTEESACTITTQDQIKYDHKFFELVEGSNLVTDGSGKDFAGNDIVTVEEGFLEFYDLTEAFEKSLPIDNKGEENEIRYVFFNSTSDCEIYPGESMLVGTFQLKVLATEGSSVVESPDDETNLKYFATGAGSVHFGSSKQDLTVTIGGGSTVAVTDVELNKDTLDLAFGAEETLVATVAPANASNKAVTWESSDPTVATVDSNGKVTALAKEGSTTITVKTADGGKTDTCTVNVSKKTQTITAADQTAYVGTSLDIVASTNAADDGATLTYEIAGAAPEGVTLEGNRLTVAGTAAGGSVTININSAETTNYAAAAQKQITVTISNKADAGVTVKDSTQAAVDTVTKTYGDPNFTLTAGFAEGKGGANGTWEWVVDDSETIEIVGDKDKNAVEVKILKANADGATITAKYVSDTTIGSKTVTVKVAKATPTVTGTPTASVTYGDAVNPNDISLTNVTTSVEGVWTWKSDVSSYGDATAEGATRPLVAVFTPNDTTNYAPVETNVNVTVAKRALTITGVSATTRDYVANNTKVALVAPAGELVNAVTGDDVGFNLGNGTANNATVADADAGVDKVVTTHITLTGDKASNYTLTQPTVKVTIKKINPTDYSAPTSLTATYGQTLANVNIAANTGWSWMDDSTSVGDASVSPKNFPAKFTPTDTTNYNVVENIDVGVTVGKKELTITGVEATDRAYEAGNTGVTLTGGTLVGVVSGDTVSFTLGSGTVSAEFGEDLAVTTDIQLTGDDAANYTLTQPDAITVTITKTPAALSTNIGDKTFIAGSDEWTEFTFTTTANDDAGVMVYGGSDFGTSYEDKIAALEYKQGESWIDMKGQNFGGATGFPMTNATSTFRVKFTADAAGNYTFTAAMKKVADDSVVCTLDVPFTVQDTVNDAWWHDGIHYCVENGLMRGVGEHEFAPGAFTNRQQVWMILARISGENPANMAEARAWAMKTGVSDGTNPTAPITRQQLAAMLYRFAGSPAVKGELRFTDSDKVSAYAVDAVLWCSDKGIVGGYTDGSFKPLDNASRAHIAAMIQRFCVNILGK